MAEFADKIELPYFMVDGDYGFDQDKFLDPWMKLGGCGAVTACDSCITLTLHKGLRLYPYGLSGPSVTKAEYVRFAKVMKPFLRPRHMGINTLEIYMDGFLDYQKAVLGEVRLRMRGLPGSTAEKQAKTALREQIDNGFPVPCLTLRHQDEQFEDYVWHWFLLTGYQQYREQFFVKAVSYGEWKWFDFGALWNTGHEERGGLVLFSQGHKTEWKENS
ncbi:MAG: hypothetical protein Q4C63_03645 [Eubacteriales bacterium]|nr:hypothetical protein [Eubacteriales bacterium]